MNIEVLLAAVSAVMFGVSNICYKLGMPEVGEFTIRRIVTVDFIAQLISSRWIIAGVALTIISGAFYIAAISQGEVIGVVAVLSLSYLVTALLAYIFLGESLTTFKIGGIGLIVLGVVLVHAGT
jgi:uncharacterized membrane protein